MAIDWLKDLNKEQKQAVTYRDGPLLILAGAGSGKTRALTYRAAYLIKEKGLDPTRILLVTFTNKAAREMKDRVKKLIGKEITRLPWMGTFHAFCARILRIDGKAIGINKQFAIYDEDDSLTTIKQAMKNLEIDNQIYKPRAIKAAISAAKNELIDQREYSQLIKGNFAENVGRIYREYQRLLKTYDALDFDDLLMLAVRLLQNSEPVARKYQEKYLQVLIDEYQDTNKAQYQLTKFLTKKWRNLTVVGDFSQCLPPDIKINTSRGLKKINQIKPGDKVLAATGRGHTNYFKVKKIFKRKYNNKLIVIKTHTGKELKITPNHILFSRLVPIANLFHVYLMYRRDKGYRIGLAKGERLSNQYADKKPILGLATRGNQEMADKMWILKTCKSRADAEFWESFYTFNYGVPSMVFDTGGRSMKISQVQINKLFSLINTRKRANKLMADLGLDPRFPHYRPRGMSNRRHPDRQIIHLKFFEDPRISQQSPWCAHRISLNTTDKKLEEKVKKFGFYTRAGKKGTWRTELMRLNYKEAEKIANKLSLAGNGLEISYEAYPVNKSKKFLFQPASHLQPFMVLPVIDKNKCVKSDRIIRVKQVDYCGFVYDLDIDKVHNYCANNIVVHNSIYSWRGADFRNLNNLKNDFPDIEVVAMEQNYRSTKNILAAANQVIAKNSSHPILKLWAENQDGPKIKTFEGTDDKEEVQFIVNSLTSLDYQDTAILYRTNAQSRIIEEALIKAAIPYILVGGVKFYSRREIKDCLAYLRFLINPKDKVSYERLEKIGKRQLEKFINWKPSGQTTREKLEGILKETKYLDRFDPKDEEDLGRLENIKELMSVAEEYPDLEEFLENAALVEQGDMVKEKTKAVTLMTLHASKGLEFKNVFMVGMEEGLFPHSRSLMDREELEEERRLCYVGMTRAKENLCLSYSRRRLYFGSIANNAVSRFLGDIEESLLESINDY
ncbi:UvrD-helicase domain-containing protein [Patescibacteria group bacterium]|nr:UvrD-helicase domain-containing protein [Patescibacteria group bacterium]